jgi:hypothetical protein
LLRYLSFTATQNPIIITPVPDIKKLKVLIGKKAPILKRD